MIKHHPQVQRLVLEMDCHPTPKRLWARIATDYNT